MASPQYAGAWPRIRKRILARDNYVCQVRGPRCTITAEHVDHIVPVSKGGAWWDASNLRASCARCNGDRVDRGKSERWRTAGTHITLVVGPPGAGKAARVQELKGDRDLVVDYDALAHALGGGVDADSTHGAVSVARNALLQSLRRGQCDAPRAWIISANAAAESIFPYHDRVVVDPGIDVATDHALATHDPQERVALVRAWYRERNGEGLTKHPPSASREW